MVFTGSLMALISKEKAVESHFLSHRKEMSIFFLLMSCIAGRSIIQGSAPAAFPHRICGVYAEYQWSSSGVWSL